jgi:hypothetical protein
MSLGYVKLQKVIQDFSLGLQYANQLAANVDAVASGMADQHGTEWGSGVGPGIIFASLSPYNFNGLGRHNGGGIPRATLYCSPQSLLVGGTVEVIQWCSNPVVTSIGKFGTGQYFFGIAGLTNFFGHGAAIATSSAPTRLPPACWAWTDPLKGPVGLWVQLYDLAAGAFSFADVPFALTIYGTVN